MRRFPLLLATLPALALACAAAAGEPGPPAAAAADPLPMVEFSADLLSYDENIDVVTASGNVVVKRDGRVLTADTVVYNRRTGQVAARGNVMVDGGDGSRAVADQFELSDTLRDGVVENMLLVLDDGSRLAARSGVRKDGIFTFQAAAYSPCKVTDLAGCPQRPVWSLQAVRVVHDPERNRIFYTGARLELLGVPVLALPRLSHPASLSQNESGLLAPDIRYTRELGGEVRIPYYWAIAPDRDLTVTGRVFTGVAPLLGVQYRQLFDGGPVEIGGLFTYARGQALDAGSNEIVTTGERVRGYFEARGRVEHGGGWRSSFSSRLTNDDNFLGRYQVSLDSRLRSTYALERFAPESYFAVRGWFFQDLRSGTSDARTPFALPLVDFAWRIPEAPFGGQLMVQANSVGLFRSEGQSMGRALASVRWDRSSFTPLGQRITLTGMVRGDVYVTGDSALADDPAYAGRDGWTGRLIPLAAVDVEWPFTGPIFGGQQTISPRLQMLLSSGGANARIPNEDSRAIDLEDSNLFSFNRFPGFDRWDGGARMTYGVDWRWTRPGLEVSAQVGQSYRLTSQDNSLPEGTGLAGRFSDFVGRGSVRFGRYLEVTQRLRLDRNSLAVRRNETDVAIGSRRTFVSVGYLKFNRNINQLEDLADHEEVRAGARLAINRYWALFGAAVVDLTSGEDSRAEGSDGFQPIRHRLGVSYTDECFDFALTWKRNYVDNPNARIGNTFLFTLALRNLG